MVMQIKLVVVIEHNYAFVIYLWLTLFFLAIFLGEDELGPNVHFFS